MDHARSVRAMLAVTVALLAVPAFAQFGGGGMGGMGGMGGHRHGGGGEGGGYRGQRGGRRRQAATLKPVKRSDFDAKVKQDFAAADLDHNGLVTLQEVHAARDAMLTKLFDERFSRVDANHDGVISHDEFVAWQRQMGSPDSADEAMTEENDRDVDSAKDAAGGRGRLGGRDGDGISRLILAPVDANLIVNADQNHDLALSLAEDLAYQDKQFDAADSDHDGTLSADELRALRQKLF
jgi:Ca2+-binding EF-hand superfamily protein